MPTLLSYPGVYIEEVPSGVRSITSVATSIAAFIGNFSRGPIGQPVRLLSAMDFDREFGGLRQDSLASYAIQHFFLNGGSQAWVVRTAAGTPVAASAEVTANSFDLTAVSEGVWGNNLKADVEILAGSTTFHLTVREVVGDQNVAIERFLNLSLDSANKRSVVKVLANESRLVRASLLTDVWVTKSGALDPIPDLNGEFTVTIGSSTSSELSLGGPVTSLGDLAAALQETIRKDGPAFGKVRVTVSSDNSKTINVRTEGGAAVTLTGTLATALTLTGSPTKVPGTPRLPESWATKSKTLTEIPDLKDKKFKIKIDEESEEITYQSQKAATLAELASDLQAAFRTGKSEYAKVTVTTAGTIPAGATLAVQSGTDKKVEISGELATELGLNIAANVIPISQSVSVALAGGSDGDLPRATELTAALSAFDRVDLVNILCIPDTDRLDDASATTVIAAATAYAQSRRAFYIIDIPNGDVQRDTIAEAETWLATGANPRHPNTAAYFPRPRIADPLDEFRLRTVPSSGILAGLYARTDGARGVWKAPAGLEATLFGVQDFELTMTDAENGVLNPLGLNCLRTFRLAGNVSWGSRTLRGADGLASEWKHIPVRRLALFLEESLYRGTQFAVFEPNDEPLWSQIRLNVGAFMQGLFVQGAFQGTTPRQAYVVKCDSETTTQADINRGVVNVLVGFAPLVPTEFVVVRIQQLAGQTQ